MTARQKARTGRRRDPTLVAARPLPMLTYPSHGATPRPDLMPRFLSRLAPTACLLAGLSATISAHAEEPITTDRPDFVESSDVVGKGRVKVEAGMSFESNHRTDARLRTIPTLLRIGVSETVELRAETDGYAWERTRDASTGAVTKVHGYSDTSLGLKWHAQDGDEASGRPSMAWLLHVDVDSGSSAFRGDDLRPSLRGVAEWELPHDASIGVMGGVLVDRNAERHRYASGILAVTLGKSLTPKWRAFIELAGVQLAERRNGGSVVTADTGLTYLLTDSVQLDLSLARGLTHDSPYVQWGFGASIRF